MKHIKTVSKSIDRMEMVINSRFSLIELIEATASYFLEKCGFTEDDLFWITVALREGVNNAIKHGNLEDTDKAVSVIFERFEEYVEFRIRDQGEGFDLQETVLPDPLCRENLLKNSGRGIFYMKQFMDGVEYRTGDEDGSVLVMRKNLPKRKKQN